MGEQLGEQPYHHGQLRQALVEAATEIIDTKGPAAISIRALARELGVSSAAPFRHFADKDALLDAIAEEAAAEVERRLHIAAVDCDDALTQFRAMTIAYVRYAAEHPALFRLIHARWV